MAGEIQRTADNVTRLFTSLAIETGISEQELRRKGIYDFMLLMKQVSKK